MVQSTQSSENASDSDPRNKQHDDNEDDRQQTPICGAVDDGIETQIRSVCVQVDDGCVGSPEAVLWYKSRTIELKTYCDGDADEYVVRPRVCLPGSNLNGNEDRAQTPHVCRVCRCIQRSSSSFFFFILDGILGGIL